MEQTCGVRFLMVGEDFQRDVVSYLLTKIWTLNHGFQFQDGLT
jgi:hypothetical protein